MSRLGNPSDFGATSVTDLDVGQSEFRTNVTAQNGAWGDLTIDRNGNWTYWVANRDVQELKDGATHTDTFTVRALDGTTQQIRVTIDGANDAPQLKFGRIRRGLGKTRMSARSFIPRGLLTGIWAAP